MKVIGINGSPRKGWNTDTLVKKALEGAAASGAETEEIRLYDQALKGCLECYVCKLKDSPAHGLCAIKDNMRPWLEKTLAADAIVIGSPNYFGYPTAMVRAFLERFLFPLGSYDIVDGKRVRPLGKRVIPAGMIFTMNAPEKAYEFMNYQSTLGTTTATLQFALGYAEQYNSYNTLQFKDYSRMAAGMFNPEEKKYQHEHQFPIDEKNCFEMGKRLVAKAKEMNAEGYELNVDLPVYE